MTALTAFETCRKLNSACCNYLHFPLHAIHEDQIFDEEIDRKCCVKNLSRFLTNNIAKIFKEFCYIGFLKLRIILKLKRNKER